MTVAERVSSPGSIGGVAAAMLRQDLGYPSGHLGHLTAEEADAFARFKIYVEEKGAYRPGCPPSHDDPTLLRFLRARRWVMEDAYKQLKDTEDWKKANSVEAFYDTIDVEAYEQGRRLYPQWTGRCDRRGLPIYLFEIRHVSSKTISVYEKSAESNTYAEAPPSTTNTPTKLLCFFAFYENLTRFTQPFCTELPNRDYPRTPVTLSTNIVDVSGVSLRQFWNLKAHMQAASQLASAHYPETMDRIFIVGAPVFFNTVWGWIKRWFDPNTVNKILVLSANEVKPTLEAFMDPKNIPKQFGGELDFKWGDGPTLDPIIRERAVWENGYSDFPKGPAYWRAIDGGKRLECVAVGSVNQVERMERVCTIPRAFPEEKKKHNWTNDSAIEATGLGAEKTPVSESGPAEAEIQ